MADLLYTFFLSMIPVSELRVAIPLGLANGQNVFLTWLFAVVGNVVPVPFLMLFIRRLLDWISSKSERMARLVNRFDSRIAKKADRVRRYERLGLLIFVAIPLPGTGAWTGAAIAAFLDLRIRNACISILIGLMIAGMIVSGITLGVLQF